jgi:hypothetical protein
MVSSDATLHTIHMDGAAVPLTFPFLPAACHRAPCKPRPGQPALWRPCLDECRNVRSSPPVLRRYRRGGRFQFTDVPGTYQIVAWHEGWNLTGKEQAYDVLTQHSVQRPVFHPPQTWEKSVTVTGNGLANVDFALSSK